MRRSENKVGMEVNEIADLKVLRQEKQEDADHALFSLYEKYFSYLDKHVNLREKVRAKHVFRHKAGVNPDEVTDKMWKLQFEHWFAFDYVTVVGTRMFDLFLREQSEQLSKQMLQLSSFFLMMVLQPYKIKSIEDKQRIVATEVFNGRVTTIKSMITPLQDLTPGDVLFIRTVRAGFEDVIIGPYMSVRTEKADEFVDGMMADYQDRNEELAAAHSWRLYLKEYGVCYITKVIEAK